MKLKHLRILFFLALVMVGIGIYLSVTVTRESGTLEFSEYQSTVYSIDNVAYLWIAVLVLIVPTYFFLKRKLKK